MRTQKRPRTKKRHRQEHHQFVAAVTAAAQRLFHYEHAMEVERRVLPLKTTLEVMRHAAAERCKATP